MTWFRNIFVSESKQWTFIRNVHLSAAPPGGMIPDGEDFYVEFYLNTFRLQKDRVVATNFRGVVYAYLSLPQPGDLRAEVTSISTPGGLRQASEADLNKMISVNTRVAGPIPWQGGPMSVELGLFSIRTGNLLAPFVDYVGRVASTVGITAAVPLVPFLPLISEGLELMTGQTADSKLAIGIDTDLETPGPVTMAVIAAPAGKYTEKSVTLDADDRLLSGGMPILESYAVVSIRRRSDNPEWAKDSQLRVAWADLRSAIVAGKRPAAEEALVLFKRTAWLSSSLTTTHKERLVLWATDQFSHGFPGGGIATGEADLDSLPTELTEVQL